MEQFNGKIAIITGGASGIGRALSEELVKLGAKVTVADINNLETVRTQPGILQAVQVDVTQPEQVQALVDRVVSEHGRLDYMFNNAGMVIAGEVRDMRLEDWNRIIDVNLKGVVHGIQAAYPVMIKQGFGHIINTSSQQGLMTSPFLAAYSATKHAVVALTDALRLEAETFGVKVSVVCPGYIKTNILDTATYLHTNQEKYVKAMPIKPIEVDQVAQKILQGVIRNRAIITVPYYTRMLWWIGRLNGKFSDMINRKMLVGFRKTRVESAQPEPKQVVKA
jgi:NAD(P)-dependent dehydrogenase (short-subunit alcohol dehydrogenase family)